MSEATNEELRILNDEIITLRADLDRVTRERDRMKERVEQAMEICENGDLPGEADYPLIRPSLSREELYKVGVADARTQIKMYMQAALAAVKPEKSEDDFVYDIHEKLPIEQKEEKPEICRRCGQGKHKHLNGEICRTEGSGGPQYFASTSNPIEQKEV
jgi:hypothetical protein